MTLERTQASTSHIGEGTPRAMLAEVMKIPDPIIDPATSIVASVRDIAFTKPGLDPASDCGVASVETAELLMQGAGRKREGRPRRVPAAFFFGANLAKCREALQVSLDRGRWNHGGARRIPSELEVEAQLRDHADRRAVGTSPGAEPVSAQHGGELTVER